MNNIYKVIWSKAKNCYVVASEIARSHTKSATGSEKIGGVTRRSLLASLMALSLLCGGLGVAEATVHVVESGVIYEVLTTQEVTEELDKKVSKEVADLTYAKASDVATNTRDIATNKGNISELNGKLTNLTTVVDGKVDKADTLAGYNIKDAYTKGDVDDKLNKKADAANVYTKTDADANFATSDALTTAKTELDAKIDANTKKITDLQTTTNGQQTAIDGLNTKTTEISYDPAKGTTVKGVEFTDAEVNANGKGLTGVSTLNTTGNATVGGELNANGKVSGNGLDAKTGEIKGGSLSVTGAVTGNSVNTGTLSTTGNATVGGELNANGKVSGNGLDAKTGEIKGGSLSVTGAVTGNSVNTGTLSTTGDATVGGDLSAKNTEINGTLHATGVTTLDGALIANGEATFEKNVTVKKDLTVDGKLNVDKISLKNDELKNGKKHDSATTITADEISNLAKVTEQGNTTESQFTHNEKGTYNYAKDKKSTGEWKSATSNVTADGVSNKMTDSDGNRHTYSQTATESKEQLVNGDKSNFEKKTAEGNTISIKDKDADGNYKSLTNKQTVDGEKTSVTNKESSSTINQGADQIRHNVTSADGKKSSIEVKADGITNTSDGTITNDANHIENKANTMDTTVTGKATESYGELETTVNGQATENFNSGLNTTVTGAENHTVTGKQINTVGDGQINNITGGQKNNILTGDQETTVSNGSIINKAENGDISNTAKNVTNEGTESVTNKVGNNEVKVFQNGVDITAEAGKKITESVGTASRVVENDKITDKAGDSTVTTEKGKGTTFGKAESTDTTNIYGDSIKTGTINAKDTTTDKLTAGAAAGADGGRLTVDAKDGVKGSYKSDKYTSRSYILENTLKSGVDNDKKPTDTDFVGSRTDHYMEGDKAKLDETVKDAAGSNVTNKTSTGTVTTITDGTTTTKTEQTESMVQSYVGKKDGSATNVTTNFANASANMVTEDGKTSTVLNNKDGLLVRNTANGKSFNTADGTNTGTALEWTNVKGNEISTGKVEANYVKMDYADVMQDLGVRGNAKIAGKTTTGSLEVTGTSTLKGDVTMGSNATVMKDLSVGGTTTTKTLNVTENATVGGTLDVTQKATFHDDVDIKKNLSVVGDVTANSYKVGDKTYIDKNGIHANGQKITDVADGSISEGSKDAVNGGQLYNVKNDLEGKVNKVGANAAAMANLHPMEFDPDSKWNIAAAIGNYGSETAAALGAFYRPNDDVMVNLSTAFGTGENMVGGGVSVRLGKGGNKLSREESNALKDQVNDLTARMDALLSVLNPNMSKDFPDVPENHWAYEAVSRLAGNDIVQGYPDGEFHGERTMTRYEMAEIIYNALSRGAEAEKELVEEFKPELQAMAASEKATAERAEG